MLVLRICCTKGLGVFGGFWVKKSRKQAFEGAGGMQALSLKQVYV